MQHRTRVHRGKPHPFHEVVARMTGLDAQQTNLVIRMGGAYLGKHRCKDGQRLVREGQSVSAYYRLPLVMEPVAFDPGWIIAQRHGLLLTAKPAGLPTQGRRDADYMAFYELVKQAVNGYVALHHRLDQGTSGAMVFVTDRQRNPDLAQAFRERLVEKTYWAIVPGPWPFASDQVRLDGPIAAERGRGPTRYAVRRDGKAAQSDVTCLMATAARVLVVVKPLTGRTHQIRVHLADAGLPIVGDRFYGGPPAEHLFLHCAQLCWPQVGKLIADGFQVPPPAAWQHSFPDFCEHLKREESPC